MSYLFAAVSDDLLKADMKTITNEECIEKAPKKEKKNVYPSHICAHGGFGDDPDDEDSVTEEDSCQVIWSSVT